MTIELPEKIIKASHDNPRRLLIFSQPKVGKTTLLSGLENCLILDLEEGSDFIDGLKIKINNLDQLLEVCNKIKEKNEEINGYYYNYIAIDTVTALEDMVKPIALSLYNQTPMGKTYKGDILSLPNGAGYKYLRDAFDIVYNKFDRLSKCLILIAHVKDKSISKQGKDITARDINLTGKIKFITASKMDAIGYLMRKSGKNILSFVTNEDDLATGARPAHLRNAEFVISEENGTGIKCYWENIFK